MGKFVKDHHPVYPYTITWPQGQSNVLTTYILDKCVVTQATSCNFKTLYLFVLESEKLITVFLQNRTVESVFSEK